MTGFFKPEGERLPTKVEYIRECKDIWRKIKASGLSKYGWLETTEEGRSFKMKRYTHDCPLCEQYREECYALGYNGRDEGYPESWFKAIEGLKEV
jgi:hypothetical protein